MSDADTIRAYFEPFLDLDPRRYDDVIKDLDGAIIALEHKDMGKIDDVANDLADWRGSAADSFNEERLATFKPIVSHQVKVLGELVLAATASREIAVQAQKDIITILLGAEAALEALDKGCGCSKDELSKFLGIVIAVAGAISGFGAILGAIGASAAAGTIAATAGIAGARIGAGGGVLSFLGVAGLAGNNFKSDASEITLKGDTVDEVLASAKDAIEKLNAGIDDQETKVTEALGKDITIMNEPDMQVAGVDFTSGVFEPPA